MNILIQNKIDYKPKVSVIIPVYNAEKYLRQCLDSVVNQTYKNLEIICVNDGSTDNSSEILKEYASKDDRIILINQNNQGNGCARNVGLSRVSGEYISFIDSDDFILQNTYASVISLMIKDNLDILMFGHFDYIDGECRKSFTNDIFNKFKNKKISKENLIQYFLLGVWNKIFKSSFLKDNNIFFPKDFNIAEDAIFGTFCAICNPKFDFVTTPYYMYRRDNSNSITHKDGILIEHEIKAHKYITQRSEYIEASQDIQLAIDLRTANSLLYVFNKIKDKNIIRKERHKILSFINWMDNKYKDKIINESIYVNLKNTVARIPVVLSSDNNYVIPTVVCMYSILEKTSSFIDFFILHHNLEKSNLRKIKESMKEFKNYSVTFVDMNNFNLEQLPQIDRFTRSCYSRYFIPEICLQYDKVIYSDVDVVFNDDIKKYYEIGLDGYGIAASSEELGASRNGVYNHEYRKKIFNISQNHSYFANGNLIIDCDYWMKNNITEKLINKTIEFRDKLICPDLDVMNIVFQNNYKKLHFKYCATVHRYNYTDGNNEMIEGYRNPFIIHYSGNQKPWNTSEVAYYKEFNDIFKKTVFYNTFFVNKKCFKKRYYFFKIPLLYIEEK